MSAWMKFASFHFVSHRESRPGCKRLCMEKSAFRFGVCEVKEK